jgi:type I restriction enzyme, S subunit
MEAVVPDDLVIPEGWMQTTLGAIGQYLNGRAFKTAEWSNTGRPIIRIQDLTGSTRNPNYFEGEVEDRHVVHSGDFLISWSATLGAYIWDGPEAVLNQHIFKVKSKINKKFHYHLVRERIAELERNAHGSGMVHVTKEIFANTLVAIPQDEHLQRQIADVIDAAEVSRASAAGHLAAGRRAIERFRQSVLTAGCSGSLTAEWRIANGRQADSDQPAGWRDATVESLAADVPGAIQSGPFGSNLKHSEFQTKGRLVIGIDNVLDGRFVLGSQHRISEPKFAELQKYEARPLDVLITVMATVGRVCVVPSDIERSIITKHVYRITVDQGRVLPFFLMYALRGHPRVREQIHAQTRGQTRPGINGQIVKGLVIAVPPIDEQREIVARIDHLLALAHGIRDRVEDASRRVDRSAQAVLAKAFRGDLTLSSD